MSKLYNSITIAILVCKEIKCMGVVTYLKDGIIVKMQRTHLYLDGFI